MKRITLIFLTALLFSFTWKSPQTDPEIVLTVDGIENDEGQLILDLFSAPKGFPTKTQYAILRMKTEIENGKARFRVKDLEPGGYAIALMHDKNKNDKLETNFLGMPKEGVGASNNAKGFMGPPSYKDASFTLETGVKEMSITMIYY